MMRRDEWWAVLAAMVVGAAALVYFAAGAVGQVLALHDEQAAVTAPVDTSGWQTYHNADYGFTVQYPPTWVMTTTGLAGETPFVMFGDPLEGVRTYTLTLFIQPNPNQLSSGEFVHQLLADDRAQGTTPPQYEKSFFVDAGAARGYELFNVFEFDHNAEQVYVAHAGNVLRFDFPVATENPNLNLPVAHNAVAHEILATLQFDP